MRNLCQRRSARTRKRMRAMGTLCAGLVCVLLPASIMAQGTDPAGKSGTAAGGAASPAGQATPSALPQQNSNAPTPDASAATAPEKEANPPRESDRRKAAKLYLDASKLFLDAQFEQAAREFDEAAQLDTTNKNYKLAAGVARGHEVTALIQAAAKDRLIGNDAAARAALSSAIELDPRNIEANQHLDELADDAARPEPKALYEDTADTIRDMDLLLFASAPHSFHTRSDSRQIIQQVFQAYGVKAMLDDSVRSINVRLDLDDATFAEAARIVGMVTKTFYVAIDAHHALVAEDTHENRLKYERQDTETMYLTGLSDDEITEVENVATKVFDITQAKPSMANRTITFRGPASTLNAFNATMRGLLDGKSQVLLDVRMIQVAHTANRNTGLQLPQTITAFNVFAEEQMLLSQNQSLVQQIISSGLASANDPLAILGILIASGQVSSSLFSQGFAIFGGGLTQSAVTTGSTTINLNLNTSDSRELDQIQFRLQDGEKCTLKEGSRYPIQTSSFSSLSNSNSLLAGLSSAGTSSNLSSLLSSLTSTVPNVPMVQYQDLGLTLEATPKVLRSGDVALDVNMKLDALSGTSIDGNPVLDNRAYASTATIKEGEAAVVATEVDKSQSLAISGTPGISEIPGLNDLTDKTMQQDYATIVIVMTPHVIRGTQAAGHSAMMRVEKSTP
jgi:general secretion pathway protein D